MRNKKIYLIVTLFIVINLLSACSSKPKEPTPTPDLSGLMINSTWIKEPLRSTESNLTLEVIHVSQVGNELILRVKFPLQDWRNWYISKVGLSVEGGESYHTASTQFYERLYQKNLNSYCLYQPVYNEIERCLESKPDSTYQIDEIVFQDISGDLTGKKIEFEVIELSTQTWETDDCAPYRLPYMQAVLDAEYTGLTLECSAGVPVISETSGFAADEAAQATLQKLVEEAGSGSVRGPWRFEFSKP